MEAPVTRRFASREELAHEARLRREAPFQPLPRARRPLGFIHYIGIVALAALAIWLGLLIGDAIRMAIATLRVAGTL